MAKYRENAQDTWKTLKIKALDSMPVGTIVDYDGQSSDIPTGWEEYTSNILYENASGSNSTINLSETIDNYSYIAIEYTDNNRDCYRLSNLIPTNHCYDNLDIWGGYSDNGTWHYVGRTSFIKFVGTTGTWTGSRCGLMDLTNSTQNASTGNYIYITKVIGYK